jgi:DNA-directed RNA polymerase subunit RPC12/RpoP
MVQCSNCELELDKDKLRQEKSGTSSGDVRYRCPDCSNKIFIGFYCKPCDEWHNARVALKQKSKKALTKYICPSCDGLIREGEVLDVKQGA